jgi:hypothetical protein
MVDLKIMRSTELCFQQTWETIGTDDSDHRQRSSTAIISWIFRVDVAAMVPRYLCPNVHLAVSVVASLVYSESILQQEAFVAFSRSEGESRRR